MRDKQFVFGINTRDRHPWGTDVFPLCRAEDLAVIAPGILPLRATTLTYTSFCRLIYWDAWFVSALDLFAIKASGHLGFPASPFRHSWILVEMANWESCLVNIWLWWYPGVSVSSSPCVWDEGIHHLHEFLYTRLHYVMNSIDLSLWNQRHLGLLSRFIALKLIETYSAGYGMSKDSIG